MENRIKAGYQKNDRLDRARRIEWLDVDSISKSSALVIGAGALGNEVVKNLALSGFNKISIVDFDVVERSNLSRCVFFTEEDVSRSSNKAECLAEAVSKLSMEVNIDHFETEVERLPVNVFGDHDLIFGCLDNFNARLHLNSQAYNSGRAYIDGGMHGSMGRVFLAIPPCGPCLECASNSSHSRIASIRYSCTGSSVEPFVPPIPAEITTTSIIAAIIVREGLRLLSKDAPGLDGQMIFYDGLKSSLEILEVDRDPRCPHHCNCEK